MKEQYAFEPGGACCRDTDTIPMMRVRDRLDAYVDRKDYDGAARHLEYWLAEARALRDVRGEFAVRNEMMGVYRKMGDREKALASAEAALALIPALDGADTVGAGTAYVNAGTVCDCFGDPAGALEHFEAARQIYESRLDAGDARLGGLYNNMALALADLRRFDEAFRYYALALEVMERQPCGQPERAITYLNMANAAEAAGGLEEAEETITEYLRTAEALLAEPSIPRNGYYAFVCEKCAPTFAYYGWFQTAADLRSAAEAIYAQTDGEQEV